MNRTFFLALAGAVVALTVMGGCSRKDMVRPSDGGSAGAAVQSPLTEGAKVPPETAVMPSDVAEVPAVPSQKGSTEGAPLAAGDISMGLEAIFFNFDSAILSEQARAVLQQNAELLQRQPSASIRIEGHCDEIGSDEYNLVLGEKRARAARQYLVNLGIPEQRLTVISYGEERPASPDHDEESLARNRRDEFVVIRR